MAIGLDWGTSTVIASKRVPKKDTPEEKELKYREQRNCYFPLLKTDAIMNVVENSNINIVDLGKGDYIYAIGEDAINLATSMGGEILRPMSAGVLQGDMKALRIMQAIAGSVLLDPKDDDKKVVYSVPANPIDKNMNIMHHKGMAKKALENLGWEPVAINEGLSVVYATNPKSEIDGQECAFTGIGISFGGGQINTCVAYKGIDTLSFSLANALGMGQGSAGDWIDKRIFDTYGEQFGSEARCVLYKEKFVDLEKIGDDVFSYASEVSEKSNFCRGEEAWHAEVLMSIEIFYEGLMEYIIDKLHEEFENKKPSLNGEIDFVLAGGTAIPNGFEKLFEKVLSRKKLNFSHGTVTKATDPQYAVSRGCLIAAEAGYTS